MSVYRSRGEVVGTGQTDAIDPERKSYFPKNTGQRGCWKWIRGIVRNKRPKSCCEAINRERPRSCAASSRCGACLRPPFIWRSAAWANSGLA